MNMYVNVRICLYTHVYLTIYGTPGKWRFMKVIFIDTKRTFAILLNSWTSVKSICYFCDACLCLLIDRESYSSCYVCLSKCDSHISTYRNRICVCMRHVWNGTRKTVIDRQQNRMAKRAWVEEERRVVAWWKCVFDAPQTFIKWFAQFGKSKRL